MKKDFYSIKLGGNSLSLNLFVLANLLAQGVESEEAMNVEKLSKVIVKLVSPGVSGALVIDEDATKPCYLEIDDNRIIMHLSELEQGTHYLYVVAAYGTNTRSILTVTIESTGEAGETTEDTINWAAVETVGDGGGGAPFDPSQIERDIAALQLEMAGKADGSFYRVGESGDPAVRDVVKIYGHSVELSNNATATGLHAIAEGSETIASGENSHAEGSETTASGNFSHAEGSTTTANGENSHAEGSETRADGDSTHAEGFLTSASGDFSHAEGRETAADGEAAHTEGGETRADGEAAHAEGGTTIASGNFSHAEGYNTIASGNFSHAEGYNTIASGGSQHVCGKFNVIDEDSQYAFIVGNGNDEARSNAFAIDWGGNLVLFNEGTPVVLSPAKLEELIS